MTYVFTRLFLVLFLIARAGVVAVSILVHARAGSVFTSIIACMLITGLAGMAACLLLVEALLKVCTLRTG